MEKMRMNRERDEIDDLFRSKLYDFEAETEAGDWDAVERRLQVGRTVTLRRRLLYVAAAAAIALVIAGGSMYLLRPQTEQPLVAKHAEQRPAAAQHGSAAEVAPVELIAEVRQTPSEHRTHEPAVRPADAPLNVVSSVDDGRALEEEMTTPDDAAEVETKDDDASTRPEEGFDGGDRNRATGSAAAEAGEKKQKARRWGFGMGGGSVSAGTSSTLNTYALKNTPMADHELMFLNSAGFESASPKTNVKHKTPLSLGMSVSYALNSRFALVSGLSYSYLSSSWETADTYHNKTHQKLHFVGIPLSLSYKIAEWKRFNVYASAGAATEVNVAGKLTTDKYMYNELYERESEHIRMKQWLWSVNARAGVSYPLIRFVSLYAEVGADYYFDNGSALETVRSEKPFNVSLQAGFRLGF